MHEPKQNSLLRMTHIAKSFPGIQALQDVSVELFPGEVLALIGENGAGKSTFLIPPAEGLGPGWEELLIGLGSTGPGEWIALEEPARLGILHHEHPLFDGVFSRRPERVDLPSARGWHSRTKPGPRERRLLSFSHILISILLVTRRRPPSSGFLFAAFRVPQEFTGEIGRAHV